MIHFLFPNFYKRPYCDNKWLSYSNYLFEHRTLCFDNMESMAYCNRVFGSLSNLNKMSDIYPFSIENNISNKNKIMIRPKRIMIMSSFTPIELFSQEDYNTGKVLNENYLKVFLESFNNRFKVMSIEEAHEFTGTYFDKNTHQTHFKDPTMTLSKFYKEYFDEAYEDSSEILR